MSELTPIEQKEIEFQGNELTAVLVQDSDGRENVYVVLRSLIEGMGLSWGSQRNRIKRNPVLNEVCKNVFMTNTNSRGNPNRLCIPISHLNGFLFGIDASRVKDEIRPLIIEYQRECYRILFDAFNGIESMTRFYKSAGFDDGWIGARIKKHETSTDLSDVWLINGVPIEHHDQLQSIMNEGAFGLTTAAHKQLKNVPDNADLRDNMTRLELLFSAIGDEAAIIISEREKPSGLDENQTVAKAAGEITGSQIKDFEKKTGGKVLSVSNNLDKKKRPLLGENDARKS